MLLNCKSNITSTLQNEVFMLNVPVTLPSHPSSLAPLWSLTSITLLNKPVLYLINEAPQAPQSHASINQNETQSEQPLCKILTSHLSVTSLATQPVGCRQVPTYDAPLRVVRFDIDRCINSVYYNVQVVAVFCTFTHLLFPPPLQQTLVPGTCMLVGTAVREDCQLLH